MDRTRHLLLALLALQQDLIDRARLLDVWNDWSSQQQGSSLADLLVQRGLISPEQRGDLESEVHRQLFSTGDEGRLGQAETTGDDPRTDTAIRITETPQVSQPARCILGPATPKN